MLSSTQHKLHLLIAIDIVNYQAQIRRVKVVNQLETITHLQLYQVFYENHLIAKKEYHTIIIATLQKTGNFFFRFGFIYLFLG